MELGRRGQVIYWLEKSRLCWWYCHNHQHPKWARETKKRLSLGSTENRAWTKEPNLKSGVVRQGELMKGEVWQGRLQSHSVSLHWPLLHHKPQRHTAGRSAGAATQPPGMSPGRLCLEAAQSSPFKEEGGEMELHGYFPSLVSQIHDTGSSFPQIPSHAPQLPQRLLTKPIPPSATVSCCTEVWSGQGSQSPPPQAAKTAQTQEGPTNLSRWQLRAWQAAEVWESVEVFKIIAYNRS